MELKKGRIIIKSVNDKKRGEFFAEWIILIRENRDKVGEIIFQGIPNDKGEVEAAIELEDMYQGQGYGSEAMDLICKWAFSQEQINYVQAKTSKANEPCQKMLRKAGFKFLSELEDMQVWEKEKKVNYQSIYMCIGIAGGFLFGQSMFDNGLIGMTLGTLLALCLMRQ